MNVISQPDQRAGSNQPIDEVRPAEGDSLAFHDRLDDGDVVVDPKPLASRRTVQPRRHRPLSLADRIQCVPNVIEFVRLRFVRPLLFGGGCGIAGPSLGHDADTFSDDSRADLAQDCAFRAVQSVLRYLSPELIAKPPRAYKDAQLARQIAIHIMATALEVGQRQITRMQGRQRTSIHFALQAVERRLECEVFRATYDRMTRAAREMYQITPST